MTHASTMRAPFRRLSEYTGLYKLTRDRLEDVERIAGGGDDHTGDLGVPVELLDVFLALVDEQELRGYLQRLAVGVEGGDGRLVLVLLDGKVPEGELVVRARRGEYGWVGRVPFDGSDRGGVP
jgi:hypothetical protein